MQPVNRNLEYISFYLTHESIYDIQVCALNVNCEETLLVSRT